MSRRNTVCGPHVGLHVCSACAMPREGRIRAAALRGSRDNSPPFTTGQMQVEGSHRLPKVTQRLSSRAGRQHPTPVSGQCSLVSLLEAPLPPRPQSHLDMPSQTPALPATLLPAQCGRCPLRWARQPPRAAFRGLGGRGLAWKRSLALLHQPQGPPAPRCWSLHAPGGPPRPGAQCRAALKSCAPGHPDCAAGRPPPPAPQKQTPSGGD